ncbi:MAG TPA: hypothetical protein PLM75_03310 [bacterium]|nr:hypothetical protein [bacterium]
MKILKIDNIQEIKINTAVLYQKKYTSNVFVLTDNNVELIIPLEFTVELTPLQYNYYIHKNTNTDVDFEKIKEQILEEIEKIHHSTNLIDI